MIRRVIPHRDAESRKYRQISIPAGVISHPPAGPRIVVRGDKIPSSPCGVIRYCIFVSILLDMCRKIHTLTHENRMLKFRYVLNVLILMNNKKLNKILQYVFILFSLIVIVYTVLFIISQEVNIKYYFENSLPNGSNNSIPICQKDFFLELILYAKVLLFYAIYGLFLSVSCIKKLSYQDSK